MKYYTGIGSRETPNDILMIFAQVGTYLARKDFVLRSGGAKGADKAFEIGCDKVNGKKEIYLPWYNFENSKSNLIVKNPKAFEIAKEFHPYWHNLSQGAMKLQARNSHQVLGQDLETPSAFVICWTKGGSGKGGTGQAIRLAKHYNIPIFDAGKYNDINEVKIELKKFLLECLNNDIKVLECSSKGDKRFSAFYAKVKVFGRYDSIENHYQLCKRFGDFAPKTWRDVKGKTPTHMYLNGMDMDIKYLTPFYKLLWCKYLDKNPKLVEYAKQFDDFHDMFKGNSVNCQADVIRQYVKKGRTSIIEECKELIYILKKNKR